MNTNPVLHRFMDIIEKNTKIKIVSNNVLDIHKEIKEKMGIDMNKGRSLYRITGWDDIYVNKTTTENNEDLKKFIEENKKSKKPTIIRKAIPKSLKNKLWNDAFPTVSEGKCYCCKRLIAIDNFHAGHAISVANGGETNINNLKPLCAPCNQSMGTMNIDDYKTKYFS